MGFILLLQASFYFTHAHNRKDLGLFMDDEGVM